MADLWELSALDLAAVIRNGDASASDAIEACINRIDMRMVVAINLLGLPVSVVPTGVAEGLPQAVQIIGPPFAEARCLRAGAAVETALGAITPIDPR